MPQPATVSFPEATRSNEILFGRPAESNNTAAWSSKSAFAGFVMPQPATGSFPESIRSNEILLGNRMKPAPSTESDFVVKMKKLNSSVLSWMNRQIIDQPLSIWKDGLKVMHHVYNPLMRAVFVTISFDFVLLGLRTLLDRNFREVRIHGT